MDNIIRIPEKHIENYMKRKQTQSDSFLEIDILIEECGELIQALSKYKRVFSCSDVSVSYREELDSKLNQICEELTHVAVSSEVVARKLGISPWDIERQVGKKEAELKE